MDAVVCDLRYGVRMLWKDRQFSVTAILTLAICFAVNIAVFSVVNSVLLQPLSVPQGDRIVLMANQYPNAHNAAGNEFTRGIYSYAPDYFDRLRDMTVYEEQAMFAMASVTVEVDRVPLRVQAMTATPSLFRLMKVPPIVGRAFDEAEGQTGNERKVILSYGMWEQLFNRDPSAIGRDLRLNGRTYQIVGVMPRGFVFINARSGDRVDLWLPLVFTDAQKTARHETVAGRWLHVARLKPGATLEQAQAQLRAIDAANLEILPEWRSFLMSGGFYSSVERAQEFMTREVRGPLYFLWGGAALLLLIGGVNITNIVLARSTMRMREIATRLALGAGQWRVVRQLVVENVVLALVSGAIGLIAGSWMLDALGNIGLSQLPRAAEIGLDYTVVGWTMTACVAAGIIIGLVPMGLVAMPKLAEVLRSESRQATAGRTAHLARHGLIVAQVALAFALLLGAGLLTASFRQLLGVDPGFASEGVVTASITLPLATYPDDRAIESFLTRAIVSARSIPGVTAVGATDSVPFDGSARFTIAVSDALPNELSLSPRVIVVTPGYFETMRIGLRRGRYLDERDHERAPRAIVIDERLARRFWPEGDPVGRTLYIPYDPEDLEKRATPDLRAVVVGVVRDTRQIDVAGQMDDLQVGTFYTPYAQPWPESLAPRRTVKLVIKAAADLDGVLRRLRTEMASIDRALPLWDVRTMAERTGLSLTTRRAMTVLTLSFGTIALFLAAFGIYGVLTYLVAQRTREVGIRIALGGTARHIVSLVLREGVVLIGTGLAVGFVAAAAARTLIEAHLYGVRSLEPTVVAIVVSTLAVAGLVACTVPARRAIKVDPMIVLNQD